LNAIRRAHGQDEVSATDFLAVAREHLTALEMDPAFLSRSVNEGFSG
ncbi:MAG TPA: Fe-S cluster assembly ATPase SufC, partial [Acidimicrobiaceae bacterium]|nr:Fe-S cluster assembly ATPase SufC [Acidimicrobiaceae bacterium]